jgi:surface carbohydrate biosynthesis protein
MTVSEPPFYLLIEEAFREFPSRVLLAALAVAKGRRVVIGQQWWLHANFDRLAPGVVLAKGNNRTQVALMRWARDSGHRVASIEEEAFGLTAYDGERLYDAEAVECCDLFLAQGEGLAEYLHRHYGASIEGRVAVTGTPRVDVLRAPLDGQIRAEAERVRAEHGQFILVNTNHAMVNPFDHDTFAYFQRAVGVGVLDPSDPTVMRDLSGFAEWERGNLRSLTRLIRDLAPDPEIPPIIIRPHPSESQRVWEEAFDGVDGVRVLRQGDHLPWTAAAELLLHTGCTTGLEAFLLGTPSVSLQPGEDRWNRRFLANLANPMTVDVSATAALVRDHLSGRSPIGEHGDASKQAIEAHLRLQGPELASERVLAAMEELSDRVTLNPARRNLDGGADEVGESPRRMEKAFFGPEQLTDTLGRMSRALGLGEMPAVRELAPAVFALEPDQ